MLPPLPITQTNPVPPPEMVKRKADRSPSVDSEKKPFKTESDDPRDKLIIALDFGTTFSGVAFSFTGQDDPTVASVMDWPDSESAPKIATRISYDENDNSSFKWGASVDRLTGNGITGVKLLLDPKQERPHYLPATDIERDIGTLPKTPIDIAADFIEEIANGPADPTVLPE